MRGLDDDMNILSLCLYTRVCVGVCVCVWSVCSYGSTNGFGVSFKKDKLAVIACLRRGEGEGGKKGRFLLLHYAYLARKDHIHTPAHTHLPTLVHYLCKCISSIIFWLFTTNVVIIPNQSFVVFCPRVPEGAKKRLTMNYSSEEEKNIRITDKLESKAVEMHQWEMNHIVFNSKQKHTGVNTLIDSSSVWILKRWMCYLRSSAYRKRGFSDAQQTDSAISFD